MTPRRHVAARPAFQGLLILAILAATVVAAALMRAHDERLDRQATAQQIRHAFSVINQTTATPIRELSQVATTVGLLRSPVGPRWGPLVGAAMREPALSGVGFVVPRRARGRSREQLIIQTVRMRIGAAFNLGNDIGDDPTRAHAMHEAVRTGRPQATPPVRFILDPRQRRGVLIYFPVLRAGAPAATPAQRRAALIGWVFGAYDADAVAATLRHRLPAGVHADILDGRTPLTGPGTAVPAGGTRVDARFAGRRWHLVVHAAAATPRAWPWTVITLGASLAALVALAFFFDRRRERYALALVAERMGERDAVEATLRRERDRSAALMRSIADGVVQLSPEGVITEANDSFCAMVGFTARELVGTRAPFSFWPPEDVDTLMDLRTKIRAGREEGAELRFMRKSGERFPVLFSGARASDGDGVPLGFICTAKDISERKRYEERLAELAAHDALTGLLNHRSFQEHLQAEVSRAHRHGDRGLSLVILDLDRFKRVNDVLGHPAGDRVLTEVAERLRGLVRQGEWLARTGGEEFAWIVPDADGVGAYAAAERARQAIAGAPFGDAGPLTLSAGVCDLSEASTADELYRLADVALYWAKSHGRNMTFRYSAAVAGELGAVETPAEVERRQTVRTLHALAAVVEAKDVASTGHTDRVAELVHRLAITAGWTCDRAARLREAALLHDVGKVALRAEVLSKPARLTADEYEHVKTHAAIGARMVASVLDTEQTAWVRQHHERWDGGGYPDGISAEEISDGGALLAMADAFDAMTSPRAYKAAMTVDAALAEARAGSGSQFAPRAVGLLETLLSGPGPAHDPGPETTGRSTSSSDRAPRSGR